MASKRKAIRHALRDAAVAANTAAEGRVETNRSSRIWRGQLPAGVIYTLDDKAEDYEVAPKTYESTLRVAVELWTTRADVEEEDDRLDDLIEEFEAALLPLIPGLTAAVEGNVSKSGYEGVEIGFDAEGERVLAGARLTLRFSYPIDPVYTGELDEWLQAHVEYDIPGGDDPDAVDDVELQPV